MDYLSKNDGFDCFCSGDFVMDIESHSGLTWCKIPFTNLCDRPNDEPHSLYNCPSTGWVPNVTFQGAFWPAGYKPAEVIL